MSPPEADSGTARPGSGHPPEPANARRKQAGDIAPGSQAAPLRVLILEDSAADADLMIEALRAAGFEVVWERAEDPAAFVEALQRSPDLVLSDYRLPLFTGVDALKLTRAQGHDVPFLLVSGIMEEDIALEAMRVGADDYVLKDRLARLGEAARRALERRRLHIQQKSALAEAQRLAAIVENSNDAIVSRSLDGIITSWNAGAERLFGYTADEAIGRPIAQLIIPPEVVARIEDNARRTRSGEIVPPYETKRLTRSGELIDVLASVSPIRNESGEITGAAIILRDISERKRAEAALRDSESRFRSFMRHLPGRAAMRDLEGRYTFVNETWLRAFAFTETDVVGRAPRDIFEPERAAALMSVHDATLAGNEPVNRTLRIASEGEPRSWLSTHFPIPDAAGRTVLVGTVSLDLSEQAGRTEKLEKLSRVRAFTSAISSLIVRVRDRRELFHEACRIAVDQGKFGIAWIGTFDAQRLEIVPVAIEGLPEEYLATARVELREGARSHGSIVARALRERRPTCNNDITVDAAQGGARTREAVRRGYRSAAALPLVSDGCVAGVFVLFARDTNYFNNEEIDLLTELAGNVSFALEHLARQDKIRKLSRIRAVSSGINEAIARVGDGDALLQRVCRIIVHDGEFDVAWAGLCDPSARRLAPVSWAGEHAEELARIAPLASDDAPYGNGVAGRAIARRAPVFINDLAAEPDIGSERRRRGVALGFRSLVALPLVVEGDPVGALTIYAREAGFFDEEEVRLLTETAGNVSFAIEAIGRREKIDRLTRIREVLGGINAAIVRIKDRRALCQAVARIAVEQGRFGMAWVSEIDTVSLDATPIAWAGDGVRDHVAYKSTARTDTPVGFGVVGQAVRTREPAICNDLTAETGVGSPRRQLAISKGYRSLAGLPLIVDGAVKAVVSLYATETNFFDDEEVALLSEMAGNISFALENMAKQEKIDKLSRIRDVTSEIDAAIVRIRDRQELFTEACRVATDIGGFSFAWIGTYEPGARQVQPVAWTGCATAYLDTIRAPRPVDGTAGSRQGAVAAAVLDATAVFVNDVLTDPRVLRKEMHLQRGTNSLAVLPLIVSGEVTGIMALHAREAGFFDDEEVALLTKLAGNLSFALEHVARQQRIDRLSRVRALTSQINAAIVRSHSRQDLFDAACRIAVEHGGFGIAWIGMVDARSGEITPVSSAGLHAADFVRHATSSVRGDHPMGQGVAGRAVRERRSVFANDLLHEDGPMGARRREGIRLGFQSRVALPLLVDGEVAAVFILYVQDKDFFTDEELKLLEELAGNISFALAHMARQEKVDKLSRIRAVSGQINAVIVRVRERDALLRETCRIASEHGKFSMVWVASLDYERREVRPVAWTGFSPETAHAVTWASIEAAQGTLRQAIETQKPAVRDDIEKELPAGSLRQAALARGCGSTVCVPLIVDGKVVSVVVLFAAGRHFFDDEELALLDELSADVSFALQTIARQEKLDYLSYYDTLTGLPNRTLFLDRAGQQLRARGSEQPLVALLLLNLERFRNINETFGRDGGDELLRLVARRLEECFRGKDYIARVAADGFGVVIRGMRDAAAVAHVVEKQVMECFRDPFALDGSEVRVAAKAGIALFPADGEDADTLFQNAEAALKDARRSSERYLFYAAEMNARAAQALSLETRLRKAVEAQQFVLHYQPKLSLSTGVILGLEALIRWHEPGTGLVPPGQFIPLLEETGLILEVGRWVLKRALADHRAWTSAGLPAPRIAVNVSAVQLQRPDFADMVIETVHQEGDNPEALELEVTESLLMKDVQASTRKLSILRGLGVRIAMDDFGTGCSSLSYIARLPIDSVKIDRSFVNAMAAGEQDLAIVSTIVALAHSLRLKVVAEGVETEQQERLLKSLSCDEAQGFLYSKPVPAGEIPALLGAGERKRRVAAVA